LFLGEMFDARGGTHRARDGAARPQGGEGLRGEARRGAAVCDKARSARKPPLDIMGFTAALRAHFDTHILSHATREARMLQKELSGKEQRRRRVRKSG